MERVEEFLGGLASALVETSRARPWWTVALSILLTAVSTYLAATILTVDTDSDRLLAPHLPVRQTNIALEQTFPALRNNLVVMIEADEAEDAREAALELRERLAAEPERYPRIFLPGYGDYYDDFGLFLPRPRGARRARVPHSTNRASCSRRSPSAPSCRSSIGAFSHIVVSSEGGIESLGEEGRPHPPTP